MRQTVDMQGETRPVIDVQGGNYRVTPIDLDTELLADNIRDQISRQRDSLADDDERAATLADIHAQADEIAETLAEMWTVRCRDIIILEQIPVLLEHDEFGVGAVTMDYVDALSLEAAETTDRHDLDDVEVGSWSVERGLQAALRRTCAELVDGAGEYEATIEAISGDAADPSLGVEAGGVVHL